MRTQVIPAQITTVEDKIAGNLNFTQILLLLTPVLLGTLIYALFPPSMHFVAYKLTLVLIIAVICLTLSIRIQGKVLVNWLGVLLTYAIRPKYYVFDKNDTYQRELFVSKISKPVTQKSLKPKVSKHPRLAIGIPELIQLEESLLKNTLGLTFKAARKGGLNVVLNKVAKES